MVTVAHLVEKIIERKPFVQEALAKGIINNAALAEDLRPEIERELNKKIKFSAVNMAVRRLAEKLEKTFVKRAGFNEDSDITIKSNLVEITLYKIDNIQDMIKKIYKIVDMRSGDFLTITQSVNEVMIITNQKHKKKIVDLFSKKSVKKVIGGLSSLTINIPLESVETVGLFYIVTRALNWENINIVDIVSTLTEMTFLIDEKDVPRAFDALKKLISENQ